MINNRICFADKSHQRMLLLLLPDALEIPNDNHSRMFHCKSNLQTNQKELEEGNWEDCMKQSAPPRLYLINSLQQ